MASTEQARRGAGKHGIPTWCKIIAPPSKLGGDVHAQNAQLQNVRSRGPLGALYPLQTWTAPNKHSCLKEGDTPSWFFFLPRGGNEPRDPSQPGWGGQYQRQPDGWYRDLPATATFDPRTTVSRWRPDFQADFARRMRWCTDKKQTYHTPERL
jgi:hypothetical protein